MSGVHLIRRQIFQFKLEEAAQYRMLSERIRMMGDKILPEALDKVLSEFVPEDVHLVIDRLELDVGTLRPEDIIDQLVPRIVAALRTALQAVRDKKPSGGVMRVEEGPPRHAAILGHFILHGRLPWWAAPKNLSIRKIAGELLETDSMTFGRIFDRVRKDMPRLRRLLQHLDTDVLINGWQRTRPTFQPAGMPKMQEMVAAVVRQLETTLGRETAIETVRLHLLQDMLSPDGHIGAGHLSRLSTGLYATARFPLRQKMPIPLRAFFDQIATAGSVAGQVTPTGEVLRNRSNASISLPGSMPKRKPVSDRRGIGRSSRTASGEMDEELEAFEGYLQVGRLESHRARSMAAEVIQIFTRLVEQQLPELSGLIRDIGRAERVRRRILDSIPSPRLRSFFAAAVPGKREAIEWVESVYLETQRKVRPINQTNIRVQRSVDEITLELFTTTDLNAMGNAAFLRLHIRRMALKHHIRYKDLIRAIWRSSSLFDVSPDGRLYQILKELYEEVFPPAAGRGSQADGGRHGDIAGSPIMPDAERDRPEDTPSTNSRERIYADLLSETERRFLADNGADAIHPDEPAEISEARIKDVDPDYRSRLIEDITEGRAEGRPEVGNSEERESLLPEDFGQTVPGTFPSPEGEKSLEDPDKDIDHKQSDIPRTQTILRDQENKIAVDAPSSDAEQGGTRGQGLAFEREDSSMPGIADSTRVEGIESGSKPSVTLPGKQDRDVVRSSEVPPPADATGNIPPESGVSPNVSPSDHPMNTGDDDVKRQAAQAGLTEVPMKISREDQGGTSVERETSSVPGSEVPGDDPRRSIGPGGIRAAGGPSPGTPSVRAGLRGLQNDDDARDASGVRTPLDLLEPVPAGLLDMLPRAVVRALILIKGTQVFGRHTRSLQELISTYIRLSAPAQVTLEDIDVPTLLTMLTEYLGVEPEFLIFAFRYSAGLHTGDALAQAVSERFSEGQPPQINTAISFGAAAEEGLIRLVSHLSAYRWYYEASHIKTLLLPALKGRRISGDLFFSLIRLLYDDQAERVEQEWRRMTDTGLSPGLRGDPEVLLDEARHLFVEATLAGTGMPFSLPRIFSRIRNILQPERTGPSVLPAGLADIRGYFSPAQVAQTAGGGRKAAIRREHSILRFYHILNLDLVLQGVGDRFFDNISFSFELLLTKHRNKLLDILRDHRFDAELAQFFANADPSGIFEQVRRLLPSAQSDRISRLFRQAVEILLHSRWLILGRNELTAFAGMDAYPYYLSPDLVPPSLSEVIYEIMRRGAAAGLLSARFRETLIGASDAQWTAQIARSIGVRRRDLIFPILASAETGSLERIGISRYRDLLQPSVSLSADDTAALTLRAILDTGRFPEGHVLRSANPASHPDYLKRLAGIGHVVERVFNDAGEGYGLMLSGLLDRGQLIRAVAARFRLRGDQVRSLTRTWFDRSASDGWKQEEFLEALLQSPGSAGKHSGRQALNRTALKLLTRTGRIGWWDMLSALQDPLRTTDQSLDGLKPEDVTDMLHGERDDWMELYFGLSQSTQPASRSLQRVLSVWMRALAIKPAVGTRRQRFRTLVGSLMAALSSATLDQDELHRSWLEAQQFFEGVSPASVTHVHQRLIRAGMPVDVLNDHLHAIGMDIPTVRMDDAEASADQDMSFAERLWRGTITPEALAALWRPGSRDAAEILSVLKSWVAGRHWNARAAERLARALPPQGMAALLDRLSPTVDLRRVIENWSVFLQAAGIYPDRQQSASAIRRIILTHRLWLHQTARRLQVELFQLTGLPEALRRGEIPADILAEGIDGVPPVFMRMAADMLATRSGITTDELLSLWPAGWSATATVDGRKSSDQGRIRLGSVQVPSSVLDFLESGIIPSADGLEIGEAVFKRLVADIREAGPGAFLMLPSLHETLVPRALEFFRPEELSKHVFSGLIENTSDAALRRYLEVFADLAVHTRVRQSDLIRFLHTYRRFFAMTGGGRAAQTEAFLRAALAIPVFAQLTRRTLSALPRSAWRATRSPFLQFIVRRQLKEQGIRLPDIDALTVFFLRTGLSHPDAVGEDIPTLFRRIWQHLSAGDPDLRATIFLHAKDRMARRRIREIFGGREESDLYEWILPGLTRGLSRLTNLFRKRFDIDIWRATGARSERDRQERVLAWWSQASPRPIHDIQILKLLLVQAMLSFDEPQWHRIRQADVSSFSEPERSLWYELRALLPALMEAPAEADRRLAPPPEEAEGTRMNEPDVDSNPVDGITVQNGGLVILWPYLGRLFTRLGLSDGKTFPGEEEQSRAIRLTEYLVTGSTEMEEHQLALNKLLCGAPLEFQVPASIDLTPEEEELCSKMLQGVIRNWEKMKATRPNTFRETFLKREARLYKVEDRWELVVARKPYDMLMDSLPWNISMIQLSWMPERLVVHWK